MREEHVRWDTLTINEMRQVLSDASISYPSNIYKKKSQFIDLCTATLGNGSALYQALQRFNKLERHRAASRSTTPVKLHPIPRRSSTLIAHKERDRSVTLSSTPVIARGRRTINVASPTQHSAFRSLAASEAARKAFHDDLNRPSETPVRKPRHTMELPRNEEPHFSQRSIVRAGRFSVPSDDIAFSPTYHPLDSPVRRPQESLAGDTHDTTQRRVRDKSLNPVDHQRISTISQSYDWPAVDPEGNPICWRIRDPFVFNVDSKSHTHSPQPPTCSSVSSKTHCGVDSTKEPQTKHPNTFTFYRPTLFLIVAVIPVVTFVLLGLSQRPSVHRQILNRYKRYFSVPPFCDSGDLHHNSSDCVPCPEHGVCTGTKLVCKQPQYQKEKHWGMWLCVKDPKVYRMAHAMLDYLSTQLAQIQGDILCGHPIPSDAIILDAHQLQMLNLTIPFIKKRKQQQWIGWSRPSLEKHLSRLPQMTGLSSSECQALYDLMFTEILESSNGNMKHGLGHILSTPHSPSVPPKLSTTPLLDIYFTRRPQKSFRCVVKEIVKRIAGELVILLLVLIVVYKKYQSIKYQKQLKTAIERIITENTSIQHLPGGKGYAVGPRASDIHHILVFGKAPSLSTLSLKQVQYPEYIRQSFTRGLSVQLVYDKCEAIVKQNADYCRSVLYVDRVPFYFNKKVIDHARISGSDQHKKATPVPF